jgi:membrane-associated phospholipid phosphatase
VLTDPPDQLKAYVMGAAVGLVVTIGCSRVYLGVHWPTDVLAAWAMACWLSLQAWARSADGRAILCRAGKLAEHVAGFLRLRSIVLEVTI